MSRGYSRASNTLATQGLWPMREEPSPSFRLGAITRRSAYNRKKVVDENGQVKVELSEESTGRQEDAIYAYVERYKLGTIVHVYPDIASAYSEKAKRPEFTNALDDLRAGRIDGLIVWKLDRLTRRRNQIPPILTTLEECGGRLISVVEGIDTADPAKRQITEIALQIYIGAAESESEAISERVRLLHLDRAKKGMLNHSRHRPFGHAENRQDLMQSEVRLLHEAAKRLLEGEAAHSIAADWTRRKVKTTTGRTRWHGERLRLILLDSRMVGKRAYGGKLYKMRGVKPIFDEAEWERVCDAIKKRTHRSGPTEVHLLSNIALCGICNRHLTSSKPQQWKDAYVCKKRGHDRNSCGKVSVLAEHADAVVSEKVIAFMADHERVNALFREYAAKGPELDAIQAREVELVSSKRRLVQALNPPPGVPSLETEDYYEQVAFIEEERQQLRRRMAVTREAAFLAEILGFEDAEKEWATRSMAWKRKVLSLVTKRIVVEPRGKASAIPGVNIFDPERVRVTFADA